MIGLEVEIEKPNDYAKHVTGHSAIFGEFGSVRQVTIWLCDEGIKMPMVVYGPRGRMVEWRLPRYNSDLSATEQSDLRRRLCIWLTGSQVRVEAGRKLITRSVRRSQKKWEVLIRDHPCELYLLGGL